MKDLEFGDEVIRSRKALTETHKENKVQERKRKAQKRRRELADEQDVTKVHYLKISGYTACGIESNRVTDNWEEVTCVSCKSRTRIGKKEFKKRENHIEE